MLELLKDRTYIRYWLAVVASFLGDAITKITLIYVVATETDDPVLYVSLVVIAQLLPFGVLGAFVGPLADRLPARLLMVGSDLVRFVLVLAMIVVRDSPLLLLVLILLSGIAKAFFETARITAIPLIVRGHSIPTAVALFQSTNHTLNLVGPALGGLLIAFGSVTTVFVLDAVTFVVSAVLLAGMAVLREVPVRGADSGREGYWQSLRTGISGVLAVPSLRFLAIVMVPVMLVLGLFTTNLNSQLLSVFELPAFEYGLAQAGFGAGCVIGALTGPPLVRRYSDRGLLIGSIVLFGASLLLLAPTGSVWDATDQGVLGLIVVLLWCVLAGLGSGLFQVPVANTLLSDLPEELRGRGVGLLNALMVNFTVLGVVVGGLLAGLVGIAASIVVAGAVLVVAALVLLVPRLRGGRGGRAGAPEPEAVA
ncbi:MFS transporter [Streptomyces virginiae]|uniref:MFS transporter n=1 Tax=Streptomyces TaxID=1883 RepID=UPI0005276975|nr:MULTISPECIES: MFS transporter [Streptomyces]MCX5272839.1 MFS transporter [Streptomyces virginiae]MYV78805.1 MFS transporter [Streptomyces sp. SID1046]WSC79000.1 MFS transporter [Streptomyces virginiae]